MGKETVKVGPLEYEAGVLNALTEPGAKRYAYKKLWKFQDSKGWVFSRETNEYNPVSDEEDREREIYLGINLKFVAILASDKKAVFKSVEQLLELAENDFDSFDAVYNLAIEANPALKSKEEAEADPNA